MNEKVCIYLELPDYLAQWYAYQCREHHFVDDDICPIDPYRTLTPVDPIKGSQECLILKRFLKKQPTAIPEPIPEKANLAIAIPYFQERDPRVYNYLGPHAKAKLGKTIAESFRICLWDEIHQFAAWTRRQDETIFCFMENHGIACNETNWNAIAKVYQRMRNVYNVQKSRKKRSSSRR